VRGRAGIRKGEGGKTRREADRGEGQGKDGKDGGKRGKERRGG